MSALNSKLISNFPAPAPPALIECERTGSHANWVTSALDRHGGELSRYALRFVQDLSHAQDIVQETFLRLCQQRQVDLDGRLLPWLFAVCRNIALDVRRKELRMSSLAEETFATVCSTQVLPSEEAEQSELTGQVLKMLTRLPENQQEVIRLKFQQGMSYKEISSVTGLTVTNVGFLIHTGLKKLREWNKVA